MMKKKLAKAVTSVLLFAVMLLNGMVIALPTADAASVTSIEQSAFNATALTDVYYTGSETQWNAIIIEDYNDPLRNATVHFASLPGDVDLDGVITASDARLALRTSVGLEELDAIAFDNADYNKDGTVSADDARSILRKSVGLDEEDVPPVEPEEPTVPVEPDEPTVPDEPDDPSVHKHSYVGCVCTCGDVQDGNFHTFLRNWIVSNHAYDENGEQFLFIEVTRPSGFSCLVSPSYNKETGQIILICQYEWDDHYWAVGIQIPHESDDVIVLGQLYELYDETTLYLITTGYTLISASEYEYGNTYYFDEYEGDDSYVDTLEDEVGFGVGIAIETLYEHLTEDCGYIFTYEDMGFPSFENGY